MSVFPKAIDAAAPKSKASSQIAILYAGLLVVMALGQLFTFEEFLELIPSFNLPLGGATAYLIAPLLVASEVLAVPFLLRMRLSPAFRVFSMFLGWLVAAIWLCITVWLVASPQGVSTVGFLGTVGDLTPGSWAICVSAALAILASWASWGLWPALRPDTRRKK